MKTIIYTRPDGGLSVCSPAEGARLAKWLTLESGDVLISLADGVFVVPQPHVADSQLGEVLADKISPIRADQFLRGWPVVGVTAEWAETEGDFLQRVSAKSIPPDATDVQIVEDSAIPTDRTFRNAWKAGSGKVEHDIGKCKSLAHDRRREMREAEFKPHDDVIIKQIPGTDAAKAEAARAAIRAKYEDVQDSIDAARSVDEIKAALQV